jgi:hypothetical protein
MSAPEPARSNSSNASFTSASLCGRHKKMGDGVRRASHVAGRVGRASRVASRARVGATMGRARADQLRARIVADVRTRGRAGRAPSWRQARFRWKSLRGLQARSAGAVDRDSVDREKQRQRQELSTHGGGTSIRTDRKGQSDHQHLCDEKGTGDSDFGAPLLCSPSRNTAVAAVAAAVRAVVRRVTHRNRAKQAAHTQSNVPRCWTRSSPRAS